MSKLDTLYKLIEKIEAIFESNYPLYKDYEDWKTWYVDVDPGFGDWNEPEAEPHLDEAISWMEEFIKKHNLQ